MSFVDKDQRITSWQTKTKHNFIETSVTSSFLSSIFPSWLELFCSMADVRKAYIRHLFFFSCRQDLFIFLFYRIAMSWRSYSVSMWSLGENAAFLQLLPTCRRSSDASETYKIILFPWRYTRPFWLQKSKSVLNIKSRKTSHVRTKLFQVESVLNTPQVHWKSSFAILVYPPIKSSNASLSWLGTSFLPPCPPFVNRSVCGIWSVKKRNSGL